MNNTANESFIQMKALFQRPPSRRLSSLFELDKRFNSKLFGEAVHPNHVRILHLAMQDWVGFVATTNTSDEKGEGTLFMTPERDLIEQFVSICSPTDATADRIKSAGQFLFLLLVLNKTIVEDGGVKVAPLIVDLENVLQGKTFTPKTQDKRYQGLLELATDFRSNVSKQALEDNYTGSHGQLGRFFDSFVLLAKSLLVTNSKDSLPMPIPASVTYSWILLWTALGYPSDPFLSEHHTDPLYVKLLHLTTDIVRLTQDLAIALALTTQQPSLSVLPQDSENTVRQMMQSYPDACAGVDQAIDIVVAMVEHKVDELFTEIEGMPRVEADCLWFVEFLKKTMRGYWLLIARIAALPPVSGGSPGLSPRRVPACEHGIDSPRNPSGERYSPLDGIPTH